MSEDTVLTAHCFKCKTKREMHNAQAVYTETGKPRTKGQCPECGTGLSRMGATPAHDGIPKPEKIEKPARKSKPKTRKSNGGGKKTARKSKATTRKNNSSRKNIGKLVIVESPAKARSIEGYLGKGYTVLSSKGHVRDLLKSTLAVDVENNFEPSYRVTNDKRDIVKSLKEAAEGAEEIYLATDPDREGEAIAWHLVAAADMPEGQVKRVVFHEITDGAVADAFAKPRAINMDLVNAQQARRILDRLVGFKVSRLLWSKVRSRLSAGRVQSIALRFVVEREKEIQAFVPVEYWTIDALLGKRNPNGRTKGITARLHKIAGEDPILDSEESVKPHVEALEKSVYQVQAVKRGKRKRRPSAPFTTSSLQQEASRRLNYGAKRSMMLAQQLYEGIDIGQGNNVGLITYMRTDSVQVSKQSQTEARDYIRKTFGDDYRPDKPPIYKTKARGAQEAHEAIRPTSVMRSPAAMSPYLDRDQTRLYKLIWERFVASQMSDAVYDTMRLDIVAGLNAEDLPYHFRASYQSLKFAGHLKLTEGGRDGDSQADEAESAQFPELERDEWLDLQKLLPEQHFTQPPPRYTEATLIKKLEEFGIGRPSTYAPTVDVIQTRDYVSKEKKRLIPTETGTVVSDLLSEYFEEEMDYTFTAKMEDQLDDISEGKAEWRPMLGEFYSPFEERLNKAWDTMPKQEMQEFVGRGCPQCEDGALLIKYSRYGKFIGCSNFPECRHREPFVERTGVVCPECGDEHGGELVKRRAKKGRGRVFYGCDRYPECEYATWNLPKKAANAEAGPAEIGQEEASV